MFLFLSFKRRRFREVCAQRECALAEEGLGALLLFSDIYICISKRERNWMLMCVWVRDLLFLENERKGVPPTKQLSNTTNGGDNRIFEEEMRLFRVIFFSLVFFVIVCLLT